MKAQPTTNSITYAGSRQTKTASCFFQISGGWTTKEHEVRTGHTVKRCVQGEKTKKDFYSEPHN